MSDINESNTNSFDITNAEESIENKNTNNNENSYNIRKPARVARTLSRNNSLLLRRNTTIGLDGAALPSAFYCPLTLSVMRSPVIDREGNSYEKYAIEHWLSNHCTSPITRKPLRYKDLSPNRSLKEAIVERMGSTWLEDNSVSLQKLDSTSTLGNNNCHDYSINSREAQLNENENMNSIMKGLFTEPKRIISSFLNHISNTLGKNIELDSSGICAFTYEAFTIVIEVPEGMRSFFIYTEFPGLDIDLAYLNANAVSNDTSSQLIRKHTNPFSNETRDYQIRLMAKMLQLNYLQQETLGGCLSLDSPTNTKVIFSYTDRVDEIDAAEFRNILENFIDSAMKLYTILKEIKDQYMN